MEGGEAGPDPRRGRVKAWPVTLGPWINKGGTGKDRRREARPWILGAVAVDC